MVGTGRGFEHRVENLEVVGFSFQKVLKISLFFRFAGHCILKNATLSTECYPIMGQNMGQTVFCKFAEIFSELFNPKMQEKVLKSYDFRTFYGTREHNGLLYITTIV